jgi:tRNA threonylcarbamoyladenosine biosynthesis protein TsaE
MNHTWPLPDLRSTQQLGEALARSCRWSETRPSVAYLRGELGAGKTTLAASILQALGVLEAVRSPSYSLMELYAVQAGQVVHLDLYRLQGGSELEQLGLRDYLDGRTLLLIEWPERGAGALPRPDLEVQFLTVPVRQAGIQAGSAAGEAWLDHARRWLATKIEN